MIERHGEVFLRRVFTPAEITFCSARSLATQHYAAGWAAKEAVWKALGGGRLPGFSWRDIEVRRTLSGQPRVALAGAVRDICGHRGVNEILLSLAHCRTHATAYALAVAAESLRELNGDSGDLDDVV